MNHIFAASHLKVSRAKALVLEVERGVSDFQSRPGTIQIAFTVEQPGTLNIHLQILNPDASIAGAVGDAAHNLRSALDIMATELVQASGGNSHQVYFPFADSAEALDIQLKKKNFYRAGQDAVSLLRSLKPYKGGNVALRGLHDLNIRDKHIALILSRQQIDASIVLERETDDAPWQIRAPEVKNIKIIFPPDSPLAGEEVIPTLHRMVETVEGVLSAFSSLVAARSAG